MNEYNNEAGMPPAGSISQICFATHDIEAAADRWMKATGAGPFFFMDLPEFSDRIYRGAPARDSFSAAMGFLGQTLIEFMQPTNDQPSIVREILESRGEGAVHHVFPKIRPLDHEAFDEERARYLSLGLIEALSFTIPGIGRNVFFDATATLGHFIELLEFSQAAYEVTIGQIYRAHLTKSRGGPIRRLGAA